MSPRLRPALLTTVLAAASLALPLVTGAIPSALTSQAALAAPAQPGPAANTFVPTASMSVRRSGATATLLGDGNVLVAGGGTAAAELYDPATGTWSVTGSMSVARTDATATLLPTGDVLVAGGCCEVGNPYENLSSAELYDPLTGIWTLTGSLNEARAGATATLLQNGEVLVAGGACNGQNYGCNAGEFLVNQRSAELYDPSTGVWTTTGSMKSGREFQTATLLQNGEVLVAGGFNSCDDDFCTDLSSAERYDPVTGEWLPTASMSVGREQHTATMLPDGDVLVAGGLNEGGGSGIQRTFSSVELYDPIDNRWIPTGSMNHARAGQTATLVNGGWVLVAGGGSDTSEVYEPSTGLWVPTGDLSTSRTDQTATLLNDGDVLVAGGTGPDQEPLATAEVFHAGAGPLVSLSAQSVTLPTQEVGTTGNAVSVSVTNNGTGPLDVVGVETSGANPSDFKASSGCGSGPVAPGASCTILVRFSPLSPGLRTAIVTIADNAPLSPQEVDASGYGAGPNVWVPTGSMSTPRSNFSSTALGDGDVLIAGGENFLGNTVATAELYDPATGSFSPTGSLNTSREYQASALLSNGSVLVAGGLTSNEVGESVLASAEIYNPASGAWTPTGSMLAASDGLTANLLADGKVLVTGLSLSNPELYDPTSGTWSETGPMPLSGFYELAVVLHNGQVLATNGPAGASALYDPSSGTWTATASMGTNRNGGTATVLQNGDVLVVGGLPAGGGNALNSAQLYDPTAGTWSVTGGLPTGRWGQSAGLLPNGEVVLAGGCTPECLVGSVDKETFIYSDGYWGETGSLPASLYGQGGTVLDNGEFLLAGGEANDSAASTTAAEVYIAALISAAPSAGAPGQSITVSGSGFYAHEVVDVDFGASDKTLATPTTDAKGDFRVTVTVPSTAGKGVRSFFAEGQTSFARAYCTFVVT